MIRTLLLDSAGLLILAAVPSAQWEPAGSSVPTGSQEQQAIDTAVDFLNSVGVDLSGMSFLGAADFGGGAYGATNPAGEVGIDFGALAGASGSNPSTPADRAAVVAAVIYHEQQHFNGGWGKGTCQEIELQVAVSGKICELACYLGGLGVTPTKLCKFYNTTADSLNGPKAQDAAAAEGCSGNTGPIGPCNCC